MNNKICCFTGHRSQKLPWGFNENSSSCLLMKEKLKEELIKSIEDGYEIFISGMALGFDIICAEMVLDLKKEYKHIKLECAIPCREQTKFWNSFQINRYNRILKNADEVNYISDTYTNTCMNERNKYMVDKSSKIIGLYNGTSGGTKSTIMYAEDKGLEVFIIEP